MRKKIPIPLATNALLKSIVTQRAVGSLTVARMKIDPVNTKRRCANPKQKKPWEGPIRLVHAMTPAQCVHHLCNSFGHDQWNQSPAQRTELARYLSWADFPDQVSQECAANGQRHEMEQLASVSTNSRSI